MIRFHSHHAGGSDPLDEGDRYDSAQAGEPIPSREATYRQLLPKPSYVREVLADVVSLSPPDSLGRERWDAFVDDVLQLDAKNAGEPIVHIIQGNWVRPSQSASEESIIRHVVGTADLDIQDPVCVIAVAELNLLGDWPKDIRRVEKRVNQAQHELTTEIG